MESAACNMPHEKDMENTSIELDHKLAQLHALQIDIAETSQAKTAAVTLTSEIITGYYKIS